MLALSISVQQSSFVVVVFFCSNLRSSGRGHAFDSRFTNVAKSEERLVRDGGDGDGLGLGRFHFLWHRLLARGVA